MSEPRDASTAALPSSSAAPTPQSATPIARWIVATALFLAIVVVIGGALLVYVARVTSDTTSEVDVTTPGGAEEVTAPTNGVDTVANAPITAAPVTVASGSPVSAAPVDTVGNTEVSAEPSTTAGSERGAGDLGLSNPILTEECDGRFITFVGSAVGDTPYADAVTNLLDQYPGTNYLWTKSCPSLRQTFADGNDIYGVVFGPFATKDEACAAASSGPADSYVRRISTNGLGRPHGCLLIVRQIRAVDARHRPRG